MPDARTSASRTEADSPPHYLQRELYALVRGSPLIFEFLQDGSLDGLWYWDLESPENEWMSPRFWTTFGYEPEEKEHLATAWQDMIHPDDLRVALDNFARHRDDPSHPYDQVVRYRHRDGSTVWIRCRGLIIRDEDGRPVRMLGAHTDVTPLKEAQAELRRRNSELEARNAQLVQFAYAASHDIQSPLRAVRNLLEIIGEDHGGELGPEVRSLLDLAEEATSRMTHLTRDIVEYAHLEGDAVAFERVELDLILEQVREDLATELEETGALLTSDPLPAVRGSRSLLRRILLNLVGNGLRYQEGGSRPVVRIRAMEHPGHWELSVRDNGIGIERRFQERIFGMFKRLHTQSEFPGSGLGLAICREAIRLHGGEIWVVSEPGKGSTFHVTLAK